MKILHINSYYSVSGFYKNLFELQRKTKIDIDVFVPVSTSYENKDFSFGEYTTLSKNHGKFDRAIFHIKHRKILNDIKGKYDINQYSLMHAHSLFSNGYIAMKLKEKYGTPYIVAVRSTDVNIFFKRMVHLRKMGLKILMDADQIIFLSESYRDFVLEKYVPEMVRESFLTKSHIIPNGIDKFWFDHINKPKEMKENSEIKLLQVGVVTKNKNVETTIKVTELLNERGYKAKLDVVGKIKDQKVFDIIKNSKHVRYLGFKSKEDLIQIYQENDIFILPSVNETFGLVYAEAMSQGLPVIYTRGQGFDQQFEEGMVGYSVPHDLVEDIADKILEITKRYNALSENCINLVHKFDWSGIERKDLEIYDNAQLPK